MKKLLSGEMVISEPKYHRIPLRVVANVSVFYIDIGNANFNGSVVIDSCMQCLINLMFQGQTKQVDL